VAKYKIASGPERVRAFQSFSSILRSGYQRSVKIDDGAEPRALSDRRLRQVEQENFSVVRRVNLKQDFFANCRAVPLQPAKFHCMPQLLALFATKPAGLFLADSSAFVLW
jgi:hypothetical protein